MNLKFIIKNPGISLFILAKKMHLGRLFPDKIYLKLQYKQLLNKKIDLKNPQSFNEKIQWLKLYDRNPIYTTLVDKYAVRQYIADTIGEEYLIPLLGVWDNVDDIDFDKLPNEFVLKCTHNSNGRIICKDKEKLDIVASMELLRNKSKINYYWFGREWPYKNVKPRIIAEKYMVDESGVELKDYKFFCFNGKPEYSYVCAGRNVSNITITFFDLDWNVMPFERSHPKSSTPIPRPKNYELMLDISRKLSQNIPLVRVDFYEIFGKIYFGELTFYPGSGLEAFQPEEWDFKFGEFINLDLAYSKRETSNKTSLITE